MIYLQAANILFLKTRKTAGTSFEIALSRHATPVDIVTPVSLVDEILRRRAGGVFPQNWARTRAAEIAFKQAVAEFAASKAAAPPAGAMRPFKRQARFFNHFGPDIVRPQLGAERFDRALKVTICRHPYEQLVSQAFFKQRNRTTDFNTMVNRILDNPRPNTSLYMFDGKPVIDVFIKYESLREDIASLERRTGLALLPHMPQAKGGHRADSLRADALLSAEQKKRCFDINRWEFEMLGYAA